MELVIVNGASNIGKAVIRRFAQTGRYSKIRVLDERVHRQSLYRLQRDLKSQNISLQKHHIISGNTMEVGLEGA